MKARFVGIGVLVGVLHAAGGMFVGPPALADASAERPTLQPPPRAATGLSDEKAETFVQASREVVEINQRWNERMQQAGSYQEREKMQEQARQEMLAVVERSGLSVEEYNRFATAMGADVAPPLPNE